MFEKDEFKEFLNSFMVAIDKETKDNYGDLVEVLKGKDSVKDPEDFNCSFMFELEKIISLTVGEHALPIFMDYNFYSANISHFIAKFTGSACSVDKARTVLRDYVKKRENDYSKKCYTIPSFGTYKQWMDYVESLTSLKHGNAEAFFKAYKSLVEAGVKYCEENS
jgi:hypothetical protein